MSDLSVKSFEEVVMKRYFAALLMFFVAWPAFAADLNGYTAQYECRAGGAYCNVDVATLTAAACDVTVTTNDADWKKITGDTSKTVYCIQAGDHSAKGALTISFSGTSGARKVLRYYRSGDNNDEPWKQSAANQATVKQIVVTGQYWIIHRIRIARADVGAVETYGKNIWNRMLIENSTRRLFRFRGIGDTLQNSVIRKAGDDFTPSADEHCTDTSGGDATNGRLVNNEIYDCTGDTFQNNNGTNLSGFVIENNDMYVTSAYTAPAAAGKSCSEQGIDIKSPGATSGNPAKIVHNRFWGFKRTDTNCGGTGSNGEGIIINGDVTPTDYILIQNNIFTDLPAAVGINAGAGGDISIIGNVIYNMRDDINATQGLKLQDSFSSEIYLNTIIKSSDSWARLDDTGNDYRCNVMIDSGPHIGSLGTGSQIDNNVYYGVAGTKLDSNVINKTLTTRANSTAYSQGNIIRTGSAAACTATDDAGCFLYKVITAGTSASSAPAYCATLGCIQQDGSMQVRAVRGPYTFYRKLHTSPERYTIPYARAYAGAANTAENAPEAFACPSNYNSRAGVGIN